MVRTVARVDENHGVIVDMLRRCGCRVQSLAQLGGGVPDLLVGTPRGQLILVEVKDGKKRPSERRLTPLETDWHRSWARYPLFVVESISDALDAIQHECTSFEVDFESRRACSHCGRAL